MLKAEVQWQQRNYLTRLDYDIVVVEVIPLKYYFCHFDFCAQNISMNTREYFPKVT